MDQAYSRLSTTHGHITDCFSLMECLYNKALTGNTTLASFLSNKDKFMHLVKFENVEVAKISH